MNDFFVLLGLILLFHALLVVPCTALAALSGVIWSANTTSFNAAFHEEPDCILASRVLWIVSPMLSAFWLFLSYVYTAVNGHIDSYGIREGMGWSGGILFVQLGTYIWAWTGHHPLTGYLWWILLWSLASIGLFLFGLNATVKSIGS